MKILAIETSCDETACAVVEDGIIIRSATVASSALMHAKYGGIVPEVAAREQLKCIIPVIEETLAPLLKEHQIHENIILTMQQFIRNEIDAIAVTVGPGLIGSLLVGVETAKTIAFITNKPIIPVNHVLAHMYANFVHSDVQNSLRGSPRSNIGKIEFPAISLVVSGGHTELFFMKNEKDLKWLGGTLDDAAGEAFDKTARLLGFENRGGPAIQEAALRSKTQLNKTIYDIRLPRPMIHDETHNFSFSGLKTAILREVTKLKEANRLTDDVITRLAYEVQEAITDVLVTKTMRAADTLEVKSVLISGGVAANISLREKLSVAVEQHGGITLVIPPVSLCTDNAVYIGSYAYFRGSPVDWHEITAVPDLSVENL